MDEKLAALAKEVQDLRQRQLQDRHESILRDDVILRRITIHDSRMDSQAEYMKQIMEGVGQFADTVARLGQRVNTMAEGIAQLTANMDTLAVSMDTLASHMDVLTLRVDALTVRMDDTDKRWNQLIDQLTREQRNGGKKRHN